MSEKFKPSMFNICTYNADNELVIFNSFQGLKSIKIVSNNKKNKIEKWLNNDEIDCDDPDFLKMVEEGYIVNSGVNEKSRRDNRYYQYIESRNLRLVIHTTEACNFRCRYCACDFSNKKMSLEVQNRIVHFIRKNINQYTSVQIEWFGGEPLMAIDVIENISKQVIEICKKAKKPYSASITSNGYYLTPENIKILLECNVRSYTITIDGTKKIHDQNRPLINGQGSYEKIISNLVYIRDNIKTKCISIIVRNNITKEMFAIKEQVYNEYNELFGADKRFCLFIRPVSDWGGERVKNMLTDIFSDDSFYEQYFIEMSNIIDKIKYERNYLDLVFSGCTCTGKRRHKYTVTVDGNIAKCDDALLDGVIGLIDKDGELVINEDKHYQWLYGVNDQIKCDECELSCLCLKDGCPKGRILRNEKSCGIKRDTVKSIMFLMSQTMNIERI